METETRTTTATVLADLILDAFTKVSSASRAETRYLHGLGDADTARDDMRAADQAANNAQVAMWTAFYETYGADR